MKLNITKTYIVDKPFEEILSKLNTIISTNFNNSKYSTFGNSISADPPEFLFMAKWASIGRPFFAKFTSTKIYAKLFRLDNKSKIVIITQSNPGILFFIIFSGAPTLWKLFTSKTMEDLELSGIYFLVPIGILLFDRFIKNIVIASFETDITLKE